MIRVMAVALALVCASCGAGQPGIPTEPHVAFTHFEFLSAIIDSLAQSQFAILAVNRKANDPSLVERMTANQNASIELGMAARRMERFASVKDENVVASTSGSLDAYRLMRESLGIQLALYEKLDAAKSIGDLTGTRKQISNSKVIYQQATRLLMDATVLALISCVAADPEDPANHVVLNISAAEKTQLVKALEQGFGPALRRKTDDDTGPMQAARGLLADLENKWKHAKVRARKQN